VPPHSINRNHMVNDSHLICEQVEAAFREILPVEFSVESHHADASLPTPVCEHDIVKNSVPKRVAEFIGGRWCAHAALTDAGAVSHGILKGPFGEPLWPDNVIGSITHESRICAAAVSTSDRYSAVGIDIVDTQRNFECDRNLFSLITRPQDTLTIIGCEFSLQMKYMLFFSIKESVVKILSPLLSCYLDLREIVVTITPGGFSAKLNGRDPVITGHWKNCGTYLLSCALLAKQDIP